jgi:hypothetical protein
MLVDPSQPGFDLSRLTTRVVKGEHGTIKIGGRPSPREVLQASHHRRNLRRRDLLKSERAPGPHYDRGHALGSDDLSSKARVLLLRSAL